MLDLRTLLELAGLDPNEVLVVRHAPVEKELRKVLPWLVIERPDLFLAYQRVQWQPLEKAMTRARYIASFVGNSPAAGTFAGIYRINGWDNCNLKGYRNLPGNAELMALGMTGRSEDMPDCLAFELERLDHYSGWIGRLVVTWPKPHQLWWRWAGRGTFAVDAIAPHSLFVREMPDWQDLVLSWSELQALPPASHTVLAQWRGIYFIYDTARAVGYVGSACGGDNILGRWRNYAKTGHGGNRELRNSAPENLRFSILQRTSPDLELQAVVALESSWKERLHTREFGLNRN
ncbi:GIY-YIG nuclease family protein [Sphingomonas sp. LT1P40]|uniref:GIY-YIG nuclease family protein n=1 Tax=Alteristakelama amylovorans TaxID=3096166 RepID=UPI002FC9915A